MWGWENTYLGKENANTAGIHTFGEYIHSGNTYNSSDSSNTRTNICKGATDTGRKHAIQPIIQQISQLHFSQHLAWMHEKMLTIVSLQWDTAPSLAVTILH